MPKFSCEFDPWFQSLVRLRFRTGVTPIFSAVDISHSTLIPQNSGNTTSTIESLLLGPGNAIHMSHAHSHAQCTFHPSLDVQPLKSFLPPNVHQNCQLRCRFFLTFFK